jgi:NADPH-dependent ferric siderophore reductase
MRVAYLTTYAAVDLDLLRTYTVRAHDPCSGEVHGGNGHGASRLTEVVESIRRPEGVGYVWVSGETSELRGVRRHLPRTLGLPASAYRAVGYWTENAQQWNARYQALERRDPQRAERALGLGPPR